MRPTGSLTGAILPVSSLVEISGREYTLDLFDYLEVLDDTPAAAGQVPPSGLESLADLLNQVARVAAYLALQILERGFGSLERGLQTR
jgi:hypothetical protein